MNPTASILFDARLVLDRPTGIGQYIASLLPALADAAPDLRIHILHRPDPWPGYAITRLDAPNVSYHQSPLRHMSLRQHLAMPALARRLGVQLLHYPHFDAPVYWRPLPVVATIYDAKYLLHPEYFPAFSWAKTHYMKICFRNTLRRADAVITLSDSSRAALSTLFPVPPGRIKVIHGAADPRFAPATEEAIAGLRSRTGIARPFLLSVGEMRPHKNFTRLVQAYAASKARSCYDLVIIGQRYQDYAAPQETAMALQVADRVHFLHDVGLDDLITFYSAADLFVLVSLYEGFGLPILEAGACGVPIIAAATTATGEIAGEGGLRVDPTDVAAMTAAIDRVIHDDALRRDLAHRSRQRAAAFSWRRAAEETAALYRQVIDRKGQPTP